MGTVLFDGFRGRVGAVVGLLLLVLFCSGTSTAQSEMDEMSLAALLSQSTRLLGSDNPGMAVPYMQEYIERVSEIGADDERLLALQQNVRLKLAKTMAYLDDPENAVAYLTEYTENVPLARPREAYKLLAANLYEIKDYEPCVAAATYALTRPVPKGLSDKKKVAIEDLSKEERGGFSVNQLRRMQAEDAELAAEAKTKSDLAEGFSGSQADVEPDYTGDELILLNLVLAEAHAALEHWEESIAPYKYVIAHTDQEDRKGYAIMQLVNSLVAKGENEEARALIVELYGTDARYDIRVNMAMMKTAGALSDHGEYDSALMLYRMVLPRWDMVRYQQGRMNAIRRDTGLPEVTVSVVTNAMDRKETIFGAKLGEIKTKRGAAVELPPKPAELRKLEAAVEGLIDLPPYENEVQFRTGMLYERAKRPWEAASCFQLVNSREGDDSPMGERALAEYLLVLVDPLQQYGWVEKRGRAYLDTHTEALGPRMIAHAMTLAYQKRERWGLIKTLESYLKGFVASDDPVVLKYEAEMYYMQAVADMMQLNYEEARAAFEYLMAEYPDSHQQVNATYWHAMTQLFLKEYEAALAELDAFCAAYPDEDWFPPAVFHGGVCLFSLERYDEAEARFTQVIESWPKASVYSDACSMRADLYANRGELDQAQQGYEAAIAAAKNHKQDVYPTFQMVAMFDLEQRYDEMLTAIDGYLERNGRLADVAKAAYWIGKTKLAQGLTDEAVEAYRDAIVKYGGEVRQEGVDLIINEMVKVARRLDAAEREALVASLHASIDQTNNKTLQLRLRVLLAQMDGSTSELGKQLIGEVEELKDAPPPVLAVICEASFEVEDYSRAKEILEILQNRYEDSEFIGSAFKLRVYGLVKEGDYDAAVKLINEAQGMYGTDPDMAWAQLMKGRLAYEQGRLEEADEFMRAVLNVRSWRGESYAEAHFYLGLTQEAAGNLEKAFGWYQRTYVQYKGYAQGYWAAESYLASARCLEKLGREGDRRNTFRAMLFDKYVNQLPQAEQARGVLGAEEVAGIHELIMAGVHTNITVTVNAEGAE